MFFCFFTCMSEACMVAHAMAADRQTSGIMGEKKTWFASLQVTEVFFYNTNIHHIPSKSSQ